jgi:MFS family permease
MGAGFATVASLQRWGVEDATVGLYTTIYLVGQTLGNLAAGFLADRFGHKLSLELGTLASVLAFAIAWLAPAPGWFFVVFVLLGFNNGAFLVSGTLVVLEFSEPRRRPTYAGMTNTVTGIANVAAPLVGAWLAAMDYSWVFSLSAAISLAATITMHWWVREPRHGDISRL